ncbi:conserved hypothetical protein [Paenibacillus curdlanolyticus YK9]|uniref:Uncharacterized protein n=1 Tax=Paenibacillus curdlanolyticus YK9 TaxID=717606 RepID=E0ICC0_9BACL|nr:hypothetical protein [Paenibacillus curdlanolyticus]EFM09806.1 conserved hypothetical protein [Paenibacillus curdlanolyticus YK9]
MSRIQKFGRRNAAPAVQPEERRARTRARRDRVEAEAELISDDAESGLPPRRKKHPSNKQQTARLYYQALFLLFIILIVGLFLFGKRTIAPS